MCMETEEEVGHSENKRMEYKPCKVSAIQMAIIELLHENANNILGQTVGIIYDKQHKSDEYIYTIFLQENQEK